MREYVFRCHLPPSIQNAEAFGYPEDILISFIGLPSTDWPMVCTDTKSDLILAK